MLGSTETLSVPTASERIGIDSKVFPGDTLIVPVSHQIKPVLDAYPLLNDFQGAFGARTYATSSRVTTVSDQFSVRIDHRTSDKAQLFVRFNFDNVHGPLTNPNQSAINPTFAIEFKQTERNVGLDYTRTVSPHFTSETSLGYIRSAPLFPPLTPSFPHSQARPPTPTIPPDG